MCKSGNETKARKRERVVVAAVYQIFPRENGTNWITRLHGRVTFLRGLVVSSSSLWFSWLPSQLETPVSRTSYRYYRRFPLSSLDHTTAHPSLAIPPLLRNPIPPSCAGDVTWRIANTGTLNESWPGKPRRRGWRSRRYAACTRSKRGFNSCGNDLEDFQDFFTRHPLHQERGQGWVCNIGLVGRTGIKIRRVNAFWIRAIVTVDSSIFKICDGTKHRREDVAIWEWKGIIDIVVTE